MKLANMFEEIRRKHRYATADDIRKVFGDYHNVLHWLAAFLTDNERVADACVVDACTIAQTQTPIFHEWLVHWAARATVRCAFQSQRKRLAELAPKYEKSTPAHSAHPALSAEYFQTLIKNAREIHARLDVLCRFVLILRGIANDPLDEVAAQLEITRSVAEHAYCLAFDMLDLASD